jgi:CheY-like chemotaxis protein
LLSTEEDRARILVVDDDALAREIVADQLAEARYLVSTAEDGKEALAKVSSESPDSIPLDVIMPNLDGFEVCRRLKSDEQTILIPVVRLGAPI